VYYRLLTQKLEDSMDVTRPPGTRVNEQAIRGAFWIFIDAAGGQVFSLLAFLVLARLLAPKDYGVIALGLSILAIPTVLLNQGFGDALIRREDLRNAHINAAFWANLSLSVVFVVFAEASAGLLADLTGEPLVEPTIRWMAPCLMATAAGSIAANLYRRRLSYSTFALRTFVATVSGALVGVGMALLGFGVWSLVASQIVQQVVGLLVMWAGLGWKPQMTFSTEAFMDLYHFSLRVMMGNAVRFATEKLDSVIVGAALGPTFLGYYYMAQRLLMTVSFVTISISENLMLPALSRMQSDESRLAQTFVSMIVAGAMLWVPLIVGLGLIAPHLIPLMFGHKWDPAIPIVVIFCVAAIPHVLSRSTGQALLAIGKPTLNVLLNVLHFAIMVTSFLIGVQFGIEGAAWAYTMMSVGIVPFHLWALHHAVNVPIRQLLSEYALVLASGVIMVGPVLIVSRLLSPTIGDWCLIGQVPVGFVAYVIALYYLVPGRLKEAESLVSRLLPAKFYPI
jgi:O-antigen/teichoic acid export membrane protein